jgi:hypothetical protein
MRTWWGACPGAPSSRFRGRALRRRAVANSGPMLLSARQRPLGDEIHGRFSCRPVAALDGSGSRTRWMPTSTAAETNCHRRSRWSPTSIATTPTNSSLHPTGLSAFYRFFLSLGHEVFWDISRWSIRPHGAAGERCGQCRRLPKHNSVVGRSGARRAHSIALGPSCWLGPISRTPISGQPRLFLGARI